MNWLNALVSGILTGGLYAMYATGLSLVFGVMRFVNLSHGDMAVGSAFIASTIVLATGQHPFWSLVVLVPAGFAVGWIVQRLLFDRLVGADPAYQIVATFGIAIAIQNLLLRYYSANQRSLNIGPLRTKSISIGDLSIGVFPLLRFGVAVAMLAGLSLFISGTRTGRAFRATADDPETAQLMGINNRTIYAIATGLGVASITVAGVFNGAQTNFAANDGPLLLIFAFETVVIGGLGSLWGTLFGGVLLGVTQSLGAQWNSDYPAQLYGHLLFLLVLAIRPTGLFGTPETA